MSSGRAAPFGIISRMVVEELQWKQFSDGMARGLVGPFRQVNSVDGDDATRTYYKDDETVAAWMCVHGSETDIPSYEAKRTFWIAEEVLDKCSHLHVITEAEWEEWDELQDGEDDAWLKEKGQI